MTEEVMTGAAAPAATGRGLIAQSLARPYRVTIPMVVLVLLVPVYLFIPDLTFGDEFYAPELALDRMIPLQPAWALVYGALYGYLILLPIFVVRQEEGIRRTVRAYLLIWITAYIFFIIYPTVAPRPSDHVEGSGFAVWGLNALYGSDPPYNCFPSLHVAHSFVSALAVFRIHRRLGKFALGCALLVAVSTLFTKQHYVADAIAGIALAGIAYLIFLRRYGREAVPDLDRLAAVPLARVVAVVIGAGVFAYWIVYQLVG